MRVGLSSGVGGREPLTRVPLLASAIEEAGFDRLWYVDYQLPMKDAFVAMTLAATATSRIQIGPGVANARTRHISVLANAMNAINELSSGRAVLGLGTGHTAVYGVGLSPTTIDETRRALTDLRLLMAGEEVDAGGQRYSLRTASEAGPPPILLAATHRRMLELAGEIADGVVLMGAADVEMTRWQIERIALGADRAERSLSDIDIDLWMALSLGDDEAVVADVKAWAAAQARVLNRWKGDLPGDFERFRAEFRRADTQYTLSRHLSVGGPNADLVSDELALRLAIAGDAATCAARLNALFDLGLGGVTITLLSGGREERIRRFGEELLPLLRDRT
jgi:5,10-methylenetetrahydromethanopterin reductase